MKVNREGPTLIKDLGPCWVWLGARAKKGYGNFKYGTSYKGAHVVAWLLTHGALPEGKQVNHKCHNRQCVNPDHLYAGTQKENMSDAITAETFRRGAEHGNSKLTEEAVLKIREDSRPYREVAQEHGISVANVCLIKNFKVWAHMKPASERDDKS